MADETGMIMGMTAGLERKCTECGGKGGTTDATEGDYYVCMECDGIGSVLTPFGEEVFAFIEHTIKRLDFRSKYPIHPG
jgi:hypothetical protein